MKTVYPVIATVLTACLFCGCLRYIPNLIDRTAADPSVVESEASDHRLTNLPFVPPETTTKTNPTEEETVPATTQPQTETKPEPESTESFTKATEPQTEETTAQPRYGTAGRIDIPSAGIGVPLNFARLEIDDVQRIVDAPDSAAYFWLKEVMPMIADHNNQGFANLHRVKKGDVAFASSADGRVGKYVCTCVCRGTNTGTDILDNEGFSIADSINTSLIMYTCYDGWRNVLLTYWKALD